MSSGLIVTAASEQRSLGWEEAVGVTSSEVTETDRRAQPDSQIGAPVGAANRVLLVAITLAAFCIYWLSSYILEQRNGTTHFAADTWFYTELAERNVLNRIANDEDLARIFRFHPLSAILTLPLGGALQHDAKSECKVA